jgi:KDO2-lipid IV(A) lauroyltransferase
VQPAGPARLAIETGAALLPAHCWFDGAGWGVRIHPPLDCAGADVEVITQALADTFSEGIAAYPEDWHMMQPQWVADLPESRRARLGES